MRNPFNEEASDELICKAMDAFASNRRLAARWRCS
jgi:hypothetical protein